MGYSGFIQFICSKGHYWTAQDVFDNLDEAFCPKCKKRAVWHNMVDITNGSFDDDGSRIDGFIDLKVKKIKSGVCSCCGKEHVCETIYEIPKFVKGGEEHEQTKRKQK